MMTYAEAAERFTYDAVTGELHPRPGTNTIFFLDKAPEPYRSMRGIAFVDDRRVPTALVAWVLSTGKTPGGPVSAVSNDWLDIRPGNIREPESRFSGAFKRPCTRGRHIPAGITWRRSSGRWVVKKSHQGKVQEVGDFFALADAVSEYFSWDNP